MSYSVHIVRINALGRNYVRDGKGVGSVVMTVTNPQAFPMGSVLVILVLVLTVFSSPLSGQEMVFKDVKKKGIAEGKVIDTANMYADVLQFDVKGKVKDELITEAISVIIPKGNMTPQEIMLENIYGIITIGAGPEYLILKEILISEDRRKAVMQGVEQSIFILADLVERGIPALNEGSKLLVQNMNRAASYFADAVLDIGNAFRDAFGPERRLQERLKTVMPDRPPLLYPAAWAKVHQLRDGPWVFIWGEPPSPHGVKGYVFQLRNPNTREVLLETTVQKTYVVVPQRDRIFSGRKQVRWAWSVTAIGGDNQRGLGSSRGFYVRELEK